MFIPWVAAARQHSSALRGIGVEASKSFVQLILRTVFPLTNPVQLLNPSAPRCIYSELLQRHPHAAKSMKCVQQRWKQEKCKRTIQSLPKLPAQFPISHYDTVSDFSRSDLLSIAKLVAGEHTQGVVAMFIVPLIWDLYCFVVAKLFPNEWCF